MGEARIRLLDLVGLHAPIRKELDEALARVLDGGQFILGEEVEAFEREFAAYTGSVRAIGCASGSDALLLALLAIGVGPNDEVICPAYSFFATASAIARLGAKPIFADIDPATYNMDPGDVERLVSGRTRLRALLPVDLFGRLSDIDTLQSLAEAVGVPIIEDAAQAVGARDEHGAAAGSRAAIGCFSLYPSKNLGAMGDGGIAITQDVDLADELARLRVHGEQTPYMHARIGINSRLDAMQAAILRVKLRHLESWTKARRENAAWYDDAFAAAGAGKAGSRPEDAALRLVIPRPEHAPDRHAQHQYVIRVPAGLRDPLRDHLARNEVESAIYYPLGLHQQGCFRDTVEARPLPHTEAAARETLALPVHAQLGPTERERVVGRVVEFMTDRTRGFSKLDQ